MTTEARTGLVAAGIVLGMAGLVGGTLAVVNHRQESQPVNIHHEKVKAVGVYSRHEPSPPPPLPARVQPPRESATVVTPPVAPPAGPAAATPTPAPGHKVGYGPSESANDLLDFLKGAAKNAPPGEPARGAGPPTPRAK